METAAEAQAMINCPTLPHHTRQRGMTLIEILVAIVVLSIGLLGLAGLQLKGVQVNQGSVYRWQAAVLAEDIADRMRADRANVLSYSLPFGSTAPLGTGGLATNSTIQEWLNRVQTLPGGQAGITTVGNQVTITVGWVDSRAQKGSGQTPTALTGLGNATSDVVLNTQL